MYKAAFLIFIFLSFFSLPQFVYAETSLYKSAGWVATDGSFPYTTTSGCQKGDDSLYCSRPINNNNGNLYFSSFGNLASFGIPQNAIIMKLHIRVKGKNTVGQYIGVNSIKNTFPFFGQCQTPSDLWTFFLGSSDTVKEFHTSTTGNGLSGCITAEKIDQEQLTFRLNYSSGSIWAADIDNFEIAFDYTPLSVSPTSTANPTNIPTPSPTTIPTPEPFLDLPWDYKSQGKNFENIVSNPNAWFDHQYPLQNYCCEPPVLDYTGKLKNTLYYHSHSGYDYGLKHGVRFGTSVLAAAAGFATFEPASQTNGGGNVIKIVHDNGYQTWYEHLSNSNLIVTSPEDKKFVNKGQKIGEVGMTGNTNGPHIHLSVFKDINNNENFNDDYPYGLVDPLGWEGNYPDPWTQYGSGGARSYQLFVPRQKLKEEQIATTGGKLQTEDTNVEIVVPDHASIQPFTLQFKYGPFENFSLNNNFFESIASFFLEAKTNFGESITQFYQPIRLIYRYSDADLLNFEENSLLLYVLNEESGSWEALPSILDIDKRTIIAETTHFSYFAVMGKVKDNVAPTTEVSIKGDKGKNNWYRSSVTITLNGKDNENGIGLEYLLYTLDGDNWAIYKEPLVIDQEGKHTIRYQSIDKVGNEEAIKSKEFLIDKTPPEAIISYSLETFDSSIISKDGAASISVVSKNKTATKYTISDEAGNAIALLLEKIKVGKQVTISIKGVEYNAKPLFPLEKNIFFTFVSMDKNKNVKQLDQYFSLKNDWKIFTNYISSTNITKIYTKKGGDLRYTKEDKPGLVLLQLETERGNLRYRY